MGFALTSRDGFAAPAGGRCERRAGSGDSAGRLKGPSAAGRTLAVVGALCGCPAAPAADMLAGRVVEVRAGDTLTVDAGSGKRMSVRLLGAAAPGGTQPFAAASAQALSARANGREVAVIVVRKERKGPTIAAVRSAEPGCAAAACPKTHDLGLSQIAAGMAWYDRRDELLQPSEDRAKYFVAEDEARRKRLGLWTQPAPVAPWESSGGRNR